VKRKSRGVLLAELPSLLRTVDEVMCDMDLSEGNMTRFLDLLLHNMQWCSSSDRPLAWHGKGPGFNLWYHKNIK
jgi:hypothetical protein